ncbi:MAG: heme NO-binding domain-containing protein [Paracoccus sp. (in: a-proteobacteria)]|nr:heme NO-binding domain-containing protein [Paracoccus sp. (in: a-proteobacteria)]
MHGLIHRCVEVFIRERHGDPVWTQLASLSGVDPRGFRPFRRYAAKQCDALLRAAAAHLSLGRMELLEDLGHWVARIEQIRRILRFSGSDFGDFLFALEYLRARAEMVLPGLDLPQVKVSQSGPSRFTLHLRGAPGDWTAALCGLVRAMADDYGVLAVVEQARRRIIVEIPDASFSAGRHFSLAAPDGARLVQ